MFQFLIRTVLFLVGATLLLEQLEAVSLSGLLLMTPNKAVTLILLILAVIAWATTGRKLPRDSKAVWILAFYVALTIGTVHAAAKGLPWAVLASRWTTFGATFLFYFLLCYLIRTRKDLDLFLVSLVVSGLLASASAFLIDATGSNWGPLRRSGVGAGQNQAAGNLLMVIPLTYALAATSRSQFLRFVLWCAGLCLVAGAVAAVSRSAFLATLAMAMLWFFRFRRASDLRYVAIAILLAIVAVILAPEGYADRLASLTQLIEQPSSGYTPDLERRLAHYRAAIGAFVSNPLLGIGTDRFQSWAPSFDSSLVYADVIHNAILRVAASEGLLGLIPFLAILILAWRDLSRAQRLTRHWRGSGDRELRALYIRSVMVQIGFVGILVVAQFQPGTFWRGVWTSFALSTILLDLSRRKLREVSPARFHERDQLPERSIAQL